MTIEDVYLEWIESRPQIIKDMVAAWPPYDLYRMGTNQIVALYSYSEDGTITVNVLSSDDPRQVFGVDPSELIPLGKNRTDFKDDTELLLWAIKVCLHPPKDPS